MFSEFRCFVVRVLRLKGFFKGYGIGFLGRRDYEFLGLFRINEYFRGVSVVSFSGNLV